MEEQRLRSVVGKKYKHHANHHSIPMEGVTTNKKGEILLEKTYHSGWVFIFTFEQAITVGIYKNLEITIADLL